MSDCSIVMEAPREILNSLPGIEISRLFVEICPDGFVTRELGFDASGALVHRAPTASTPHCVSGGRPVDYRGVDDPVVQSWFERLWNQVPDEEPSQ